MGMGVRAASLPPSLESTLGIRLEMSVAISSSHFAYLERFQGIGVCAVHFRMSRSLLINIPSVLLLWVHLLVGCRMLTME